MSNSQQQLLNFLIERIGKRFTLKQLASKTDLSREVVQNEINSLVVDGKVIASKVGKERDTKYHFPPYDETDKLKEILSRVVEELRQGGQSADDSQDEAQPSGNSSNASSQTAAPDGQQLQAFYSRLLEAFQQIDATTTYRGAVPIPLVRESLASQFEGQVFEDFLVQLHRDGAIHLIPHNRPDSLTADKREGSIKRGNKTYYQMKIRAIENT